MTVTEKMNTFNYISCAFRKIYVQVKTNQNVDEYIIYKMSYYII